MKIVDPPTLSAVVPVGNFIAGVTRIHEWIEEIQGRPIEVIIVHDLQNSNRESVADYLSRLQKLDIESKIKFREGYFGNPGGARNMGIKSSTGEWIAFWDSDDIPRISEFVDAIENSEPETEVICGAFTRRDSMGVAANRTFRAKVKVYKANLAKIQIK